MGYWGSRGDAAAIEDLVGKMLTEIVVADDKESITFKTADGLTYEMSHSQDCCEVVEVEEIVGDINSLIGSPILLAEVVTNSDDKSPEGVTASDEYSLSESFTWTFYKLRTLTGDVVIRWLGLSNGYYSEEVDFIRLTN